MATSTVAALHRCDGVIQATNDRHELPDIYEDLIRALVTGKGDGVSGGRECICSQGGLRGRPVMFPGDMPKDWWKWSNYLNIEGLPHFPAHDNSRLPDGAM